MLSVLSGLVALGASGGAFWYFKPRNGVVHPLAIHPVYDSFLAIAILGGLSAGIALIVAGLA